MPSSVVFVFVYVFAAVGDDDDDDDDDDGGDNEEDALGEADINDETVADGVPNAVEVNTCLVEGLFLVGDTFNSLANLSRSRSKVSFSFKFDEDPSILWRLVGCKTLLGVRWLL